MASTLNSQILYAEHQDGSELAVVDITNPGFRVVVPDDEIAAMAEQHLLELPQQRAAMTTPAFQQALEQSRLLRWLRSASGSYLTWLPTYILKLGPENLGAAETSPIDRHIAASFLALALRIRLQDMARLLADGVTHMLDSKPQRPVCFVNIAGGPAPDSWNALILLLKSERPELMASRDVVIAVLDLDETGPAFGGRAVAALRTPGAPLHGLEVAVRHIPFAWSDTDRLGQVLEELRARETACAISSEGAGYLNMGRMLRSLQTFICCTPEREPMPLSPDQ